VSRKVFLALPSYDGRRDNSSALVNLPDGTSVYEASLSLLTGVFNQCWAQGLNARDDNQCDYFVMLHSDVVVKTPNWVDVLLDEMEKHRAKVMSAVIPIKNVLGHTSTGVDDPTDPWGTVRLLTMHEIMRLPVTGTRKNLVVNTGLMAVDFTEPWVEKICFHMHDKIEKVGGRWRAKTIPEDWDFSRQCRDLGVEVWATRAVAVDHVGRAVYPNDAAWGLEETDEQWRSEQRILQP